MNPALDRKGLEAGTNAIYHALHSHPFQALIAPTEPGKDILLWKYLSMAIRDGVFELMPPSPPRPGAPLYVGARPRFEPAAEDRVRTLLDLPRPAFTSPWEDAVDALPDGTPLDRAFLRDNPLSIADRSPEAVLDRLHQARYCLLDGNCMTLRHKSRRGSCGGASKALDSRGEAWVRQALRLDEGAVIGRRIQLTAYANQPQSSALLFIENLDTFDACCNIHGLSDNYALV